MTTPLAPRPHQQEALLALRAELSRSSRAQMIAACGTGKTLVGRWLAEELTAGPRTLVVLPSLLLVAQTLIEWRRVRGWHFEAFVTCSDPTTAAGSAERVDGDGWEPDEPYWAARRAAVSTNPGLVARRLADASEGRPLVVFCTYHSLPVIQAAAERAGTGFDLAIFDEAHHLAGKGRDQWREALDDTCLAVIKRVFMTATPITAEDVDPGRVSMSETEVFGRVAFHLPFAEAIARGLLVDYEVLVVDAEALNERHGHQLGALAAIGRRGVTRVLSFHGRVHKASIFAAAADGVELPDGRRVSAACVSGKTPAAERARQLAALGDPAPGSMAVLSNARCLAEGIDVPAVDAVMFCDPKDSTVDVVQAVGRALRPSPQTGKQKGLIILPVVLDRDLDDNTALAAGPYGGVWRVLRHLMGLDERLAAGIHRIQIDTTRLEKPQHRQLANITFDLPADVDLDKLLTRLVDAAAGGWHAFYGHLLAYADRHGSVIDLPPSHRTAAGATLGQWAEAQRRAHRKGRLPAAHAQLLGQVPGWHWDGHEAAWLVQHAQVLHHSQRAGRLRLHEATADHTITGGRQRGGTRTTIGRWCAAQRIALRADALSETQKKALSTIPGWVNEAVPPADAVMVDLLAEYVAWKRDANPPSHLVEDDQPLGEWLDQVRRRRFLEQLPRPLEDEILEVTPSQGGPGALRWKSQEVHWLLGLEALGQFVTRTGVCRVPDQHVEELPGIEIPLSNWCRRQRHLHRHGKLHPACAAALERVPGWLWEIPLREGQRLRLDGVEHGSRTAYVRGCKCDPCTDANTDKQAQRDARAAQGLPTCDLVNAGRARGHLRILEGQGATAKGMARASGLNVKTITELLTGESRRILPESETAIVQLTLDAVRATAPPGSTIPAEPTWVLLNDLIDRGWPKAWIARELGMRGPGLQIKGEEVTLRTAQTVGELFQTIGDLRPPARRYRRPLPTLAEILTHHTTPSVTEAGMGEAS